MRLLTASVAGIATCLLLAGCSEDDCFCDPAPPSVVSVGISPDSVAIRVGTSFGFTATGRDSSGAAQPVSTNQWVSADPAIAVVRSGTVTGMRVGGPVTITVLVGSLKDSAVVVVTP
jgi:uncharacterized protein YjdB